MLDKRAVAACLRALPLLVGDQLDKGEPFATIPCHSSEAPWI
jgi:hypothetical protein